MKVTEVKSIFAGSFEGHCKIVPRQTTGWPDGSHNEQPSNPFHTKMT